MSRRLPSLTAFALLGLAAGPAPAQRGYAYRSESPEPPLADDPKAAEVIQQAANREPRPLAPSVRNYDVPAPAVALRVLAPTALPLNQEVEVRLIVENVSRVQAR